MRVSSEDSGIKDQRRFCAYGTLGDGGGRASSGMGEVSIGRKQKKSRFV